MIITNKGEFIEAIAERAEVSKSVAASVFNSMTEVVTEQLKAGESITIAGFGKFKSVHKDARTARNPQTGELVSVPERNTPKFEFGKNIKEALK